MLYDDVNLTGQQATTFIEHVPLRSAKLWSRILNERNTKDTCARWNYNIKIFIYINI
jgi:hypothetical protein